MCPASMKGKTQGLPVSGPDTVWQLVSVSLLILTSLDSWLRGVLAVVEVAEVVEVIDVEEVAEVPSLATNTLKSWIGTVIS